MTNVAYVLLLLAFVALGTFVYALAAESSLAGVIGASMVVLFAISVAGFRIGARKRAQSNDSGIEIDGANIWARPLRREQIDQYLMSYRGVRDGHEQMLQAATALPDETDEIDRSASVPIACCGLLGFRSASLHRIRATRRSRPPVGVPERRPIRLAAGQG